MNLPIDFADRKVSVGDDDSIVAFFTDATVTAFPRSVPASSVKRIDQEASPVDLKLNTVSVSPTVALNA